MTSEKLRVELLATKLIENLELLTKNVHRGQVICPYCRKEFTIR